MYICICHCKAPLQYKTKFSPACQILPQARESVRANKQNKTYLRLNQGPAEDLAAHNQPAARRKLSRSVLSDKSLSSKERPQQDFHCKIRKHMWTGFLAVLFQRKQINEAIFLLWHIHKCKPERLSWRWLVWRRKGQTDKVETQTSGKTLAALSLFMETFSL